MDISYLLQALKGIDTSDSHVGTQDALAWTIRYLEANYDDIDELLDEEAGR